VKTSSNNQSLVVFEVGSQTDAQGLTLNGTITAVLLSNTLNITTTTFSPLNSPEKGLQQDRLPVVAYDSASNDFLVVWVAENQTSVGDPSPFSRRSQEHSQAPETVSCCFIV